MSYDSLSDRCLGFKMSKNNNKRVSHVVFFFFFFFFFFFSVGRLGTDLMNFRWQVRVMANLLIPCKLLRNSKFLIICMNPLYLRAEMELLWALENTRTCSFLSEVLFCSVCLKLSIIYILSPCSEQRLSAEAYLTTCHISISLSAH